MTGTVVMTKPLSEQIGTVVSRLTFPVTIKYGDGEIRLSMRGRTQSDIIRGLLPVNLGTTILDLPAGVQFIANKSILAS
jgi:hypothetical protein